MNFQLLKLSEEIMARGFSLERGSEYSYSVRLETTKEFKSTITGVAVIEYFPITRSWTLVEKFPSSLNETEKERWLETREAIKILLRGNYELVIISAN